MLVVLLSSFVALILIGMPIVFAIGVSGAATFIFMSDIPVQIVVQKLIGGIDSFPLLAAPYFILAGMCMEGGGISSRLVKFANALVGFIRGGLMHVAVVASMIFAGISGSGVADATAVGAILIPPMLEKGYKRGFSAALIAASGSIGQIIPPSMLMIVYGSLTGLSISQLFLGGIVPGVFIGLAIMLVAYLYALKSGFEAEQEFSLKELWISFKDAFWALLTPVIIVGGIVSGIFTATEAGAIAVIYAFIVSIFVYKELKIKDIKRIFVKATIISSSVLIMLSFANIFGYIMAIEKVPVLIQNFLLSLDVSRYIVLFLILGFLVLLGCLVETMASMIILVPILVPIGMSLGFNPIHFGILLIIALNLGGITPPVGMLLFLTTSIAETTLSKSSKYIVIFIGVTVFVMLVIAFFPATVTFIPNVFLK